MHLKLNMKLIFVMSMLALSTLAIASPAPQPVHDGDMDAFAVSHMILEDVENSAGARLQALALGR
jgi:hypothetical protein